MIEKDDLRAAVSAGIISEAQAISLTHLSHSRSEARTSLQPGDEPFELFKGFNEIFIVVGLIILATGWSILAATFLSDRIFDLQNTALIYGAIGAGAIWILAEYFTRKRRMIAPSIALTILFAANAAASLNAGFSSPFMVGQGDVSSTIIPTAGAVGALAVFWLRFRVPFGLALIALGVYGVLILAASQNSDAEFTLQNAFLLSDDGPFAWLTLLLGLIIFAIAMVFDMSDPHRVTRRSANGFWLHVLAAPALVNTVALSFIDQETDISNVLLLAFLVAFSLIAIIIDRRSFLIAATGYVVVLTVTVFEDFGAAWSVLALGIYLLTLGAFWEGIRRALLQVIPGLPLNRLPPAHLPKD